MAKGKIDTSLIEGYEGMSQEDKLKALESYEYDVPDDRSGEVKKYKDQFDKVSSELASYKKKEKESLSESERAKQDFEEKIALLQKQNDELLAQSRISSYKASYAKQGYPEDLASTKAQAMLDGDTNKVLECEEKFNELLRAKVKSELTKQTPPPDDKGDSSSKKVTKEQLRKMSVAERLSFANSHPEEYKKLYERN